MPVTQSEDPSLDGRTSLKTVTELVVLFSIFYGATFEIIRTVIATDGHWNQMFYLLSWTQVATTSFLMGVPVSAVLGIITLLSDSGKAVIRCRLATVLLFWAALIVVSIGSYFVGSLFSKLPDEEICIKDITSSWAIFCDNKLHIRFQNDKWSLVSFDKDAGNEKLVKRDVPVWLVPTANISRLTFWTDEIKKPSEK